MFGGEIISEVSLLNKLESTHKVHLAGHVPQQRVVKQLAHEGSLLKVFDQATADEVVEGGAPVTRLLQRRGRVSRNLRQQCVKSGQPRPLKKKLNERDVTKGLFA